MVVNEICDDLRRGLIIFSLVLCDCLIELICDGARILLPCCCAHWKELNSRTNAGTLQGRRLCSSCQPNRSMMT